jgi:hypothetical protein
MKLHTGILRSSRRDAVALSPLAMETAGGHRVVAW